MTTSSSSAQRPSVVVAGVGFAGFYATRTPLERLLPPDAAELPLVSATDHLCYSPLLPHVAASRLDPRRIAVPLHARLHRTRLLQATVTDVDLWSRRATTSTPCPRRATDSALPPTGL